MKTEKEWEATIKRVVAAYQQLDAACTAAEKAGCLDLEGPLFKAVWESFDTMLDEFDSLDWIKWHIWDNKCGKSGLKVITGGKPAPIRTARQLARVIFTA